MRFEREEIIKILEKQNCPVEIVDSDSAPSPRVLSSGNWPKCDPREALRLLRSHLGNPGQDERDSGMMPNGVPG